MVLVSGSEDLVRFCLLALELVVEGLLALLLDLEGGGRSLVHYVPPPLANRTYL